MSREVSNRDSRDGCADDDAAELLALPPLPATGRDEQGATQTHQTKLCQTLLRFRLQQIELMVMKLEQLSKYSGKLLNAQNDLASLISCEKEAITRIAALAGIAMHDTRYVMSYTVALEQCCDSLLGST
ncbi:hypothetical protein V7S43_000331 [Phytophthora oleae]|uniref:Uncharacterized protein n=1 Tax=Phytophthora oleae TaxID=2107226 RepID=A0ABD3G8M1_9STRA